VHAIPSYPEHTMTLLIHLNGLPGVGKSTLARLYADEHHLALNLDVDLLRRALGQWQAHPTDSGIQARRLAIAAIGAHLREEFDVVVPQFLARPEFLIDLENVASETGSQFVEVLLAAPLSTIKRRFQDRTDRAVDPQHVEAAQMMGSQGSDAALDVMNRDLEVLLRDRVHLVVVDTEGLASEQSYELMMRSLAGASRRA
jgi:predicted kinase